MADGHEPGSPDDDEARAAVEYRRGFDDVALDVLARIERDLAAGVSQEADDYMAGYFAGCVALLGRLTKGKTPPVELAATLGALVGDVLTEGRETHVELVAAFHAVVAQLSARTDDGQPFAGGRELLKAIAIYGGQIIATAPAVARGRLIDLLTDDLCVAVRVAAGNPTPAVTGVNVRPAKR